MQSQQFIEIANDVGFQRLVKGYCRLDDEVDIWTVEGACVTIEATRHRTGVPRDAHCMRYKVEHPEEGWSLTGRAVWRLNKLLEPQATHTCIEIVGGDARYGEDDDMVATAINDWMKAL